MVENTRQVQSKDPFDRFDEAINDPRLYEPHHYRGRTAGSRSVAGRSGSALSVRFDGEARSRDYNSREYSFAAAAKRCLAHRDAACSRCPRSQPGSSGAVLHQTRRAPSSSTPRLAGERSTDSIQRSAAGSVPAAAAQRRRAAGAMTEPRAAPDAAASGRQPAPPQWLPHSPSREEITAAYQTALQEPGRRSAAPAAQRARRCARQPPHSKAHRCRTNSQRC